MKESRLQKRLKRKAAGYACNNLDNIYNTCDSIARDWDMKTIPLKTLRVCVDKSKMNTSTKDEFLKEFGQKYNIMLNKFYDFCSGTAKNMNSKNIPVSEIKNGIKIMKTSYGY